MQKTPLVKKIERLIAPTAESMGFDLVRVLLIGSGKPTLQIMAERANNGAITLDECGKLSQAISAVLDVENVLEGSYYLEVGSPGVDRPLTRLKDFEHYAGREAKVEIEPAIDGRKRFRGCLKGLKGDHVLMATEEGDMDIPFPLIQKAKLVVIDDLLKPQQKKKFNQEK